MPFSPFSPTATVRKRPSDADVARPTSDGGAPIKGYVDHAARQRCRARPAIRSTATANDGDRHRFARTAKTYTFTVAARNKLGVGYPSLATSPRTIGVPTSRRLSADRRARRRTAPSSRGHAPAHRQRSPAVTGYVVTPYLGTRRPDTATFKSAATTQTITGLTNGDDVHVRGRGREHQRHRPAFRHVGKVVVGTPLAPTDVGRVARSPRRAVTWHAPDLDERRPDHGIRGHAVHRRQHAGAHNFESATTTQATMTGLQAGAIYTFKVSATNSRGTGPRSHASNPATAG